VRPLLFIALVYFITLVNFGEPAFCAEPAVAQPTLLDTGFGQLYDLQFDSAHQTFQEWMRQHPEDPMGPASDAAGYLFSELDRLHILQSEFFLHDDSFTGPKKPVADPGLKLKFDAALEQSQQLAERTLQQDPQNQNAQFSTLMRLGLRSDYLALIEKRYLASLNDVKAGRAIAEKLIAANPNYCDAYLAIGVENYLLSLKSAPLRWLLRVGGAETDRERGIQNLSMTAERGHYLLPYARVLLAVAALRDKNVGRAKELLEGLTRAFPHNRLYSQELARLR
jgi:tetratricopeptide (TPR) repeat protein